MKFFLIFLSFLALHGTAQQKRVLEIWPQGPPNSNGVQGAETGHTSGRITKISKPTITVYLPEKSSGAAVIICPGGGYGFVTMPNRIDTLAAWFNDLGIAAIFLKYRLPNGHHAVPLSDLEQAMQLVKQHTQEWKLQKEKIGVMGFSAGGHLAATLATHSNTELKPAFQILLYPVITMNKESAHKDSRDNLLGKQQESALVNYYSLENHVSQNTPPAFIALSDDDKTVSPLNSIHYYTALKKYLVPAEMHIYPIGGHGWAFNQQFEYSIDWTHALKKWIEKLVAE